MTGSNLYIHATTFILPKNVGITYSDIRLILLIEARFRERYAPDLTPYQRPIWLPKSWSEFCGHHVTAHKQPDHNPHRQTHYDNPPSLRYPPFVWDTSTMISS